MAILTTYPSSNYRKHTSGNPLQQALIGRFHKRLRLLIAGLDIQTVLDAGCGEGFVLRFLRASQPQLRLIGIDLDANAAALARRVAGDVPVGVGDLYHLPFRDNAFDLVLSTEVLEHVDEPAQALRELARVSARYCLFTVPWEPMFKAANFMRGRNLASWGNDPGHIQAWSMHAFAHLVRQQLTIRYAGTSFPWTIVLAEKT
ncbi:MAG TPA: class I SAM-dependent methyltransferase [Thermomicrobiales bacterium]|nr:class I SAM-dependent methyltransferase [Thermomicrobiales bacterium]